MMSTKLKCFAAVLCSLASTSAEAVVENSSFIMRCPVGQGIRTRWAFYGRDSEGCSSKTNLDDNTLKVARKCDMRRLCEVPATNNLFKDPCAYTTKELNVEYECVEGYHSDVSWEGGAVYLVACPCEKVIKILKASFGRDECESQKAQKLVELRCNGQQSCEVPATVDFFGNPCLGVVKQLQVTYSCVQPFRQIQFREIIKLLTASN